MAQIFLHQYQNLNNMITVLFLVENLDGTFEFYRGTVRNNQLLSECFPNMLKYSERDRKYFDHYRVDIYVHEDSPIHQIRDASSFIHDIQLQNKFWDNSVTSVTLYDTSPKQKT